MSGGDIIIQALGFVGLGLILGSTFARTRVMLLAVDAAGSALMALHWSLLGAYAGGALSLVYATVDLAGRNPYSTRGRLVIVLAVPVSIALVAILWTGPADLLAGIGVLLSIASRWSHGQIRLRVLSIASSIPWGIYGFIDHSAAQVTFSVIYSIAMAVSIVRIRLGTWQRRTAPDDAAIVRADGST